MESNAADTSRLTIVEQGIQSPQWYASLPGLVIERFHSFVQRYKPTDIRLCSLGQSLDVSVVWSKIGAP